MRTEILPVDAVSLARAASFLRSGALVAFPTETVYGLGANAMDAAAVAKIFRAKERPADNPLIAHIADIGMLDRLAASIDDRARLLMERFWPGPLTLLFERADRVPDIVTAGLSTVAVRMPSHPAAQALIRAADLPIAAPSANRSGRPSPTAAEHVYEDMQGRVPLILDGGACGVGLESTVLDLTRGKPMVLRPGGVTVEMLREALPDVAVDPAVLQPLAEDGEARSPGMKHRHYAPNAQVVVIRGAADDVTARICALYDAAGGQKASILCAAARTDAYGNRDTYPLGTDVPEMAANLFDSLRAMDARGVELILAEATETDGIGLALMNRLLRAANFDVIDA